MMAALRRYLVAGLLVWVPLGVTLLIIKWMVNLMDQTLLLLPEPWRPEAILGLQIPGFGFLLTAIVVIVTGMIAKNLLGRQLVSLGEWVLSHIPVVRSIYYSVKQLAETMFSNSGNSFRQVVLIRYPHRDSWTMGFLTGDSAAEIRQRTGRELVNVFVPTTPNPTSGFFLMVPRDEVIDLDMNVDDGLKMLLSLGVVQPKQDAHAAVTAAAPVSK